MYGSPGNKTARLTFGVSGHVIKTVSAAKRMIAAACCFFNVTRAMIAVTALMPDVAIRITSRSRGRTAPNKTVGCVDCVRERAAIWQRGERWRDLDLPECRHIDRP